MSSSAVSRKIILESLTRQSRRFTPVQSMAGRNNQSYSRQYHQLNDNAIIRSAANVNKGPMGALLHFRGFSDKSIDEEAKKDVKDEESNDTESSSKEGDNEKSEKEEGPSEIEKLQAEVKEMKDQLLRSYAEQENIRRIAKKDVDNAKAFAITSFAKSLLDTSDNLTRALDAVPEEYREDKENHAVLATLFEGIKMTDDGLTKAFAKNGLTKFGAVGDKFDPNMHEALFEYQDDNMEAGSIGQVMKVGFSLKERVIRPAEVGVVKSPNA